MSHNPDLYFMQKVLDLARGLAKETNEIPVAAMVLSPDNEILGIGLNTREAEKSILGHAEINAMKAASEKLKTWNLSKCKIYVSLEPCAMCAGAILQSHIQEVIFAAYDLKAGAFGSRYNLITNNLEVRGGILESEAKEILGDFFKKLRE